MERMGEGGQHVDGVDDVGPTVSSGLDPLSDGADVNYDSACV